MGFHTNKCHRSLQKRTAYNIHIEFVTAACVHVYVYAHSFTYLFKNQACENLEQRPDTSSTSYTALQKLHLLCIVTY